MNHIKQIIFIIIVILILIVAIGKQITINQSKDKKEKLENELNDLTYTQEKLQHELDNPDIEKMANEQGYFDPGSEYYYSD